MLKQKEVAALLNVNVRELREMIRAGRFLEGKNIGKRNPRWVRARVEAWMEEP
jgi:predicted DNA-binding transcriptional regulator AlpA